MLLSAAKGAKGTTSFHSIRLMFFTTDPSTAPTSDVRDYHDSDYGVTGLGWICTECERSRGIASETKAEEGIIELATLSQSRENRSR